MSNPLTAATAAQSFPAAGGRAVPWYRSPLDPKVQLELHRRSDLKGAFQAVGHLALLALTGGMAFYVSRHVSLTHSLPLFFLHGTCYAFMINAVHELGHGTVFRTKALNEIFVRIYAFLGWINFEMFQTSHARHHRYTLHPPDDLEVVLPIRLTVSDFWQQGFVKPKGIYYTVLETLRIARGRFCGPWETALFPSTDPARQRPPIRWARVLLAGHALILALSVACGLWQLPLLVTLAPFYGGWLFFLCNHTQHIGLADNVADFRLCCRTFTLNPVARFLYWQMNYHTEHHMYAAVPCYNLGRLHRLIAHDLPACPRGIAAVWREIAAIQKIQQTDPDYRHTPTLPAPRN
jgi:fatty acid desaturase